VPQSKQTTSSGNTHTTGLSMFFSPGKWMPISAVNLRRRTDPHDLHRMPPPNRNLKSFSIDLAHDLFSRANTLAKIDLIRCGAVPRTQSGPKGRPVASRHVLGDARRFLREAKSCEVLPAQPVDATLF
jgi:hypothetical protein